MMIFAFLAGNLPDMVGGRMGSHYGMRHWVRKCQDLLQAVMVVLIVVATVFALCGPAVSMAQPDSTTEWRLRWLETSVAKLQDDATTISRLLIGLLATVVTNMALYVFTRRRELGREARREH